jgi:galactose mutarotase-like enzyme
MSRVTKGTYKGEKAIIIENDFLRIVSLPGWGSKLVSIVYKPQNDELLWQNPGNFYRKTKYGDRYEMGEVSGFDEMFPTISRCVYESFPWMGVELPDHGEVWSVPWQYETEEKSVHLWVFGVRFPYKLEKKVSIEGNCIRIHYGVVNLSGFDFDFIWAAHPLFNTGVGMELVVPSEMNSIVNSVPGSRLKRYGEVVNFRKTDLDDGTQFDLSRVPEKNNYGYQKYYFLGKMTQGWCILYDYDKAMNIGMSFPKDKVPYLGVWINEGGWEGQYNIAPEPATGAMDRVDFAKMWGMNSSLTPFEYREWYLNITVQKGKKAKGLKENGEIIL